MFAAKQYQEQIVELRRKLHQIAEPGWFEYETTLALAEFFKPRPWQIRLGKAVHEGELLDPPSQALAQSYFAKYLDQEELEKKANEAGVSQEKLKEILQHYTGLVADYDTGRPGPQFLLRFDIDAMPIPESQDSKHQPFVQGFAELTGRGTHACGHDAHMALGLCLADIIQNSNDLVGKYRIAFQPAEESVRGAYSMLKSGLADDVDYFLSAHIGLGIPSGLTAVATENILACSYHALEIQGKEAHAGSNPEAGKNALLGAAELALAFSSLTQFGQGKAWLNVGELHSGKAPNIVPGDARMTFEIRSNSNEVMSKLADKLARMTKGNMYARDLDYQLIHNGQADIINEKYLAAYREDGKELFNHLKGQGFTCQLSPDFGASEDVTSWMNRVFSKGGKAMHLMLGSDITESHHHPAFDLDENSLVNNLAVLEASLYFFNQEWRAKN